MKHTKNSNKPGYVYIITNPSYRESWIKVGCTGGPIEDRLRELQTTGVPLPFEAYGFLQTRKYRQVETHLHYVLTALTGTRVNEKREFYSFPKEDAYKLLKSASRLVDDGILSLASKVVETEDESPIQVTDERGEYYLAFWTRFLEYDKEHRGAFSGLSAPSRQWIGKRFNAEYGLSLNAERGRDYVRISIYFASGDKEANKALFDRLYSEREGIESRYDGELEWQRLSEKTACRIKEEVKYKDDVSSFEFLCNRAKSLRTLFEELL